MADQNQAMDDIAFMRALAEDGRKSPLAGGAILVAAGAIFGGTALAVWYGRTQALFTEGWMYPAVWSGALAIFLIALRLLDRGPRAATAANRAMGIAWTGAGWAIGFVVLSLMVAASRLGDWRLMGVVPSVILAIYGAAWFLAAAVSRTRWLFGVAFGAFAAALVTAWFATDAITVNLVYAAALLLLMVVPGLVLMRQARRD